MSRLCSCIIYFMQCYFLRSRRVWSYLRASGCEEQEDPHSGQRPDLQPPLPSHPAAAARCRPHHLLWLLCTTQRLQPAIQGQLLTLFTVINCEKWPVLAGNHELMFPHLWMCAAGTSVGRKVGSNEQAPIPQDRPQSLWPRGPEGMLHLQTKKRRKELPDRHPLCPG